MRFHCHTVTMQPTRDCWDVYVASDSKVPVVVVQGLVAAAVVVVVRLVIGE